MMSDVLRVILGHKSGGIVTAVSAFSAPTMRCVTAELRTTRTPARPWAFRYLIVIAATRPLMNVDGGRAGGSATLAKKRTSVE